MGIIHWISEQREKVILGPARGHLAGDEDVAHWVRARQPGTRREGFLYLTPRQVILRWTGRGDGSSAVRWEDIHTWAINPDMPGGPALALQNGGLDIVVQMPILTHATAGEVKRFMHYFKRKAPVPKRNLEMNDLPDKGTWRSDIPARIARSKRTPAEMTKRVLVTLLGLILVIGGIMITPLPGPWSFPIVLAGLAVLSGEYDWAKDGLAWAREKYQQARDKVRKRRSADV